MESRTSSRGSNQSRIGKRVQLRAETAQELEPDLAMPILQNLEVQDFVRG